MTDTNIKVREHYSAVGLTHRIKAALATVTPESEALTVAHSLHSISSTPEAFSRLASWLRRRGSIHPPTCWILAVASAGRRAMLQRLSAAR